MVDLEEFVASATFGPVASGASSADIVRAFGEPDLVTPARRSRPLMMLYGDVEFRLWSDRLSVISLGIEPGRPVNAGAIPVDGLWPQSRRTLEAIRVLLETRGVSWELDRVMSRILDDESSPVWVTERRVHLGFLYGALQRVGAEYPAP